jgi:uncharacterized membrane protein YjjP (DUF1212 family)
LSDEAKMEMGVHDEGGRELREPNRGADGTRTGGVENLGQGISNEKEREYRLEVVETGEGMRRDEQVGVSPFFGELGDILEVALKAARVMLESGANTARTEKVAYRLGTALGAQDLDISVTPTMIVATDSCGKEAQTRVMRIRNIGVDLNKVTAVQEVARLATCGELQGKEQILARLDEISRFPKVYGGLVTAAAVAAACAGFCTNLGGDWRAILSTLFASFVAQIVKEYLIHHKVEKVFTFYLCSALGSLLAVMLGLLFETTTLEITTLASILLMIPGALMVGAITDVFRQDFLSGLCRGTSGEQPIPVNLL